MRKRDFSLETVEAIKGDLKGSSSVLIISHIDPDYDAVGSALGLYLMLKKNFKGNVSVGIENSLPENLSFLEGFDKVMKENLTDTIEGGDFDLIFFLDGAKYHRFFLNDVSGMQKIIVEKGIKTIVFDHHHLVENPDKFDHLVRMEASSTAEILYLFFVGELGFKLDCAAAECLILGIVGDTDRFLYENKNHRRTFEAVSGMLDEGVSIEKIISKTQRYSKEQLLIIREFLGNTVVHDSYTYSFISDKFVEETKKRISRSAYMGAYWAFLDNYLRNLDQNFWGFTVTPDFEEKGLYRLSFRAEGGTVDTTVFSREFGGGGHKLASGGRFEAGNIEQAVQKVLAVIKVKHSEAKQDG